MIRFIDSLKNPLIKEVILIKEKSRYRKKSGQFVVEGKKEVVMALKAGYAIEKVLYCGSILNMDRLQTLLQPFDFSGAFIEVSEEVYQRIAYREKTEGLVALGPSREHRLEDLRFNRENPLVLVAESVEKPGNIGALLRTADAAALDAVIIADPLTDLYNPNILRSSLGCIFTVPLATGSGPEVMDFLRSKKFITYAAELNAPQSYTAADYRHAAAILVGPESQGLTAKWLEFADHRIIIPMRGEIDSMNVSVSAAIIIFEALRQRL